MEESDSLASLGLCLGFLLCSNLCVSQQFPCPHYPPAFPGLQLHPSYLSGVSLNFCPHGCYGPSSVYTLCRVRDPCFFLMSLTLPAAFPASLNSTQLSQPGSNLNVYPEALPGHFRKGFWKVQRVHESPPFLVERKGDKNVAPLQPGAVGVSTGRGRARANFNCKPTGCRHMEET